MGVDGKDAKGLIRRNSDISLFLLILFYRLPVCCGELDWPVTVSYTVKGLVTAQRRRGVLLRRGTSSRYNLACCPLGRLGLPSKISVSIYQSRRRQDRPTSQMAKHSEQ